MRSALSRRLRARLSPDVDPTARALLLAERDELAPELRRKFADAGLAHLLAISGLHVGIVFGLALAILSPLAGGRHRYLAAAAAVGLYVSVLGAPIPALRASLLCFGWAVARFQGTPIRGSDLLGAAALLFLVVDPGSLATPGFQLSFAGYAGVSLGLRVSREAMPDLRPEARGTGSSIRAAVRVLIPLLAAGAGAFLATAPIAARHFGRIAPISILSNLAGTPIVALSIWSLVGAMLPDPLGGSFAAAAVVLLRVLHSTADWFGSGAISHFDAAPPLPETWLAWAVGFASLSWLARGAAVVKVMIPLASAVALVIAQPIQQLRDSRRPGMICTLSVGQGDAAILRTHRGRWIVFDGGPSAGPGAGREEIRTALRRRGARSVALVTISHPDLDHIGGMEGLLTDLPVGGVLDTGDVLPRDAYARLLDLSGELGIPWIRARAGLRIQVDEVEVLVLGPDSSSAADSAPGPPSANETSLIVRVAAGGFRYLNSGDARMEEERNTLAAWPAESLRADLLKIGHHGSRTSSSQAWIAAIRPSIAVISAGAGNRFGHPHAEVLKRIEAARVPRVWRTDRSGTLCIDYRMDGSWRIPGETAWNAAVMSIGNRRHED
jgi:competence protein ComEC